MINQQIVLTALGDWWREISGAIITLLTIVAFWPKLRDSAFGKLLKENKRLRGLIADMILEEAMKDEVIRVLEEAKRALEKELLAQHREDVQKLHRAEDSQGSARR